MTIPALPTTKPGSTRPRERAMLDSLFDRFDVGCRQRNLYTDELLATIDTICQMRLAAVEHAPDSVHVKALKEAGIYPTDQAMVRYVDWRARRGGIDPDDLFSAAIEWAARGYNRGNISRICDWAQFGIDSDAPVAARKAQA